MKSSLAKVLRPERLVDNLTTTFVLLLAVFLFSTPLRDGRDLLPYAQDDFYYYLKVAQNLADGLGSTFDGTTLTNGYHPLYELFLWGVLKVVHGLRGVFCALWLLNVLSATVIFLTTRALFARRFESPWISNGLAMAMVAVCSFNLYENMEVTIALPLGFAFVLLVERDPEKVSPAGFLGTGAIAGLLILSRLDSALLVALTVMAALLVRDYRLHLTGRKLLTSAGGCIPWVLLYLALNHRFFGRFLPISGAAKQLKQHNGFALGPLWLSMSKMTVATFVLCFAASCCVPWVWRRLTAGQRVICVSGLLFPFLHWGALAWMSDWKLWGWYTYSLRLAVALVFLVLGTILTVNVVGRQRRPFEIGIFAAAVLLLGSARYKIDPAMTYIAVASRKIQAFAETHPGRYAMGDRAGMVGYVDGQPTIQTEGLVMDDAFLDHIRRQDSLREVLRQYRIDYYIAFDQSSKGPCFQAKEPANAGPGSSVMRGEFCETPARVFSSPDGRTLVFDLRSKIK